MYTSTISAFRQKVKLKPNTNAETMATQCFLVVRSEVKYTITTLKEAEIMTRSLLAKIPLKPVIALIKIAVLMYKKRSTGVDVFTNSPLSVVETNPTQSPKGILSKLPRAYINENIKKII